MLVASGRHGTWASALLLAALVNIALSIWLAVTIRQAGSRGEFRSILAAVHLLVEIHGRSPCVASGCPPAGSSRRWSGARR